MHTQTTLALAGDYPDPSVSNRIGRYALKKQLGTGASSTVSLATDTLTNKDVALKVIDDSAFSDPQYGQAARNQFLKEVSLVGKLIHPHIVAMTDALVSDDVNYIALEYVPGGNLLPFTHPQNLLPVADVIEIGCKCCDALRYAYRAGIIHCDIKPANLLLAQGTDIKVADFGAALLNQSDLSQICEIGSPAYMSPEHITGCVLSPRSDMFSLAVVLYQLLTGHKPFSADTTLGLINQIRVKSPAPMQSLRQELPPELDRVLARALAKRPDERYSTWTEFALELARLHT